MKIALIGYGKMGKLIGSIAEAQGHTILGKTDSRHFDEKAFQAEVWIDFSHPDCALENIQKACQHKKNVVMGTTGWYHHLPAVEKMVKESGIGMIYAPNFSIGVNLFLEIVAQASSLLQIHHQYDAAVTEAHHRTKADAPSGTALAIQKRMAEKLHRLQTIDITSTRCGSITGTHSVYFDSPADTITLTHQAHNREGFAIGAVAAAEWIQGKSGIHTIKSMLYEN